MAPRSKMVDTGDMYPLEKKWHISRGIPLGLIFSMSAMFLAQTGTALWFFAHQDSRLDAVEKVQVVATTIGEKLQAASAAQGVQTARLEEKVVSVQASVNRIEALLTKPR
jgi:hypothetical protein